MAKRFPLLDMLISKIKATTSLGSVVQNSHPSSSQRYDILRAVSGGVGVKQEHTWNMDEKGVQLGI